MPARPFTALERQRSEHLFLTAAILTAAAGPPAFWWSCSHWLAYAEQHEQEMVELMVNAAAEPLMRRLLHQPGQLRFSFARLSSLFAMGNRGPTDAVLNAFRQTRFRPEDLPRLMVGLRIPHTFNAASHVFLGEEGLLVLLVRLSYPGRNADLAEQAGRWPSATSACFSWMVQYLYDEVCTAPILSNPAHLYWTCLRSPRARRVCSLTTCATGAAWPCGWTTSGCSQMQFTRAAAHCVMYLPSSTANYRRWPGRGGTKAPISSWKDCLLLVCLSSPVSPVSSSALPAGPVSTACPVSLVKRPSHI